MSFISNPGSGGPPFAESYTLATRPAANNVPAGTRIVITNALGSGGQTNSLWYSNGNIWVPFSDVLLASTDTLFSGTGSPNFEYLGAVQVYANAIEVGISLGMNFTVGFSGFGTIDYQIKIGPNGSLADATAFPTTSVDENSYGIRLQRKVIATNQLRAPGTANFYPTWTGDISSTPINNTVTLAGTNLTAANWFGVVAKISGLPVTQQSGTIQIWALPV
jgi:hypothetical protein